MIRQARPARSARLARWLALVAATLALLGLPAAAHAHGVLRASEPRADARLRVAPRLLRLVFNEPVELAVARLELLGPDGRAVALSALRRGDSAAVVVADVTGALAAGGYTVAWQVAGRDGHPVRGRFRFAIDSGAAGLAAPAPAVRDTAPPPAPDSVPVAAAAAEVPDAAFDAQSPAYATVRWLGFAAMLALVGAVGFRGVVVPAAVRRGAPAAWAADAGRGTARLAVAAAALLLVVALLRLGAQSFALHGAEGWRDGPRLLALLGATTWGWAWLLQAGAALLALAGLWRAGRAPSAGWAAVAVAAAGLAVGAALSGHAAGVPQGPGLAVAVDTAHVLGAGGWLGTLLPLLLVGVPAALRLPAGDRARVAAATVDAFSPLALACAALVAVTGGVSAWLHLGTLAALWTSPYGRTLLVKLALLSLVALAGAYNWRRVRPALADEAGVRTLRRSATLELLIAAAVLAVTAVLVATPTDVVS